MVRSTIIATITATITTTITTIGIYRLCMLRRSDGGPHIPTETLDCTRQRSALWVQHKVSIIRCHQRRLNLSKCGVVVLLEGWNVVHITGTGARITITTCVQYGLSTEGCYQ